MHGQDLTPVAPVGAAGPVVNVKSRKSSMDSTTTTSSTSSTSAPTNSSARSIASELAAGVKDFDDAGSIPLVKDARTEAEILNLCRNEASALPPGMALACIRTRKYDAERARKLMREFAELLEDMKQWRKADVLAAVATVREGFRLLPLRDKQGRAVLNTRLRHHDPRRAGTEVTIRALTLMLYNLLLGVPFGSEPAVNVGGGECKSTETQTHAAERTQLNGVCVFHDFRGLSLGNVDPGLGRGLIKLFSGRFPLRLGAVYMLDYAEEIYP
eukprot:g18791.t1